MIAIDSLLTVVGVLGAFTPQVSGLLIDNANQVTAGLVFDSSVIQSTWFTVLGAFVAFNTLVYLGLSFSRFLWWPRQSTARKVAARMDEWRSRHAHHQQLDPD